MLSKILQKHRQIDACELGELALETKKKRGMSMMSSQLHLRCFHRPVALHILYSRNKEVEPHLLGKEVGVS